MTAARHARPRPAGPLTAALAALAIAAAGLAAAWHSPGNATPPPPRVTWATWNTPWFTERWPVTRRQP